MRILFDTNILLDALLGLDAIVTRDLLGFVGSPIPVLSPVTLRQQLEEL